ncbi:MAG TPA: TIGR01777 family oxidoreductase [Terriglobales bacterium]|nr:TIGR01777 family oxidoreductase [Terriglobales bacterium]
MANGRILVSGASGPIGAALLPSLRQHGYAVMRLVRGMTKSQDQIGWDPLKPVAPEIVSGFEVVIHLAGESIVGRWTEEKKKAIRDSRVVGTRHLAEALAQASQPPRVFLSGSAIGYYGDRGDEILNEDSLSGQGFLAEVSREWEAATQPAAAAGIRTVHLRTGVVLSAVGGALPKMLPPFKLGVGGIVGSGRQWWSWIDVQDEVGAMHHILKTESLTGPVNLVAPHAVTNAEFTKTLAAIFRRPAFVPVPAFAARLAFGPMADELLLASQHVEPTKLLQSEYSFQSTDLVNALSRVLGR